MKEVRNIYSVILKILGINTVEIDNKKDTELYSFYCEKLANPKAPFWQMVYEKLTYKELNEIIGMMKNTYYFDHIAHSLNTQLDYDYL
jgi:hypothetical protein